jgi:iron(III) transport system substrate-binding protein
MKDARRRLALILGLLALASPAAAMPPPPSRVTPALVAAAKKEGRVVWYTSIELHTAEKIAAAFEKTYPGIKVQIERNGAERLVERLAQERASKIRVADAIECSDMTALLAWKEKGWLAPFLPGDVADKWPAGQKDPDADYATERFTLSPLAYNPKLVKPADAPTSYADLLDKKWDGKIVKAHPDYSGTIMTVTFELARVLGWDYFKKLGKQHVLQVQGASEPASKVAGGERAAAADGVEYFLLQLRAKGAAIVPVYPREGTPMIPSGAGVVVDAPHPNAARLFTLYLFSREGQQALADIGWMRSVDPDVVFHHGERPLSRIKVLTADPAAQAGEAAEIKKRYAEYFGI